LKNRYGYECKDNSIILRLVEYDEKIYVSFIFCCEVYTEIIRYPLDCVCNDFDKYWLKCIDILATTKICTKCNKYHGFDMRNPANYILAIASNYACAHKCTYCAVVDQKSNIKQYTKYSRRLMDAVLNSKNVFTICPNTVGEPFEDKYIRDTFLFNLHKCNINSLQILTNGAYADKEYINKLKNYLQEHNILTSIVINVSGFNKQTYESYCTCKYETMLENVKTIVDTFGDDYVVISYVVSKHNISINETEVLKQYKQSFPYLNSDKSLQIVMDITNSNEDRKKIANNFFKNITNRPISTNLREFIYNKDYTLDIKK